MKASSSIWIFLVVICCSYVQADDAASLSFSNSSENETAVPDTDTSSASFSIPTENTGFDTNNNAWDSGSSTIDVPSTVNRAARTSFAIAEPSKKKTTPAHAAESQVWIGVLPALGGLGIVIVGVAMMRGRKRSSRSRSLNYEIHTRNQQRPVTSTALAAQLLQAHNNANTPSGEVREEVPSRRAA